MVDVNSLPYQAGYRGYDAGMRMIDNPYDRHSDEWELWRDGWKKKWFERLTERNRRNP